MSIRDGLIAYYKYFGLRGVVAITSFRLRKRPTEILAQPAGIRNPVYIRLRTSDVSTYSDILLRREYEIDLPFSPRIIVDGGANIGMASIFFAHKYPEAKIISVEAEASNYAMLVRNVQPYSSIVPIHAALWNRDGYISVGEPDPATGAGGKWGFVTREGPGGNVRAITMHTLMQEMGIPVIDLAKIDIEGAEQEVFQNAQWLSGVRCLMIELHDRFRPGCSGAVKPALREFSSVQKGETSFYLRKGS